MPREWNTEVREPWNPVIKSCLNAIDYHISFYVLTNDPWHFCQAQKLRDYVAELKTWIQSQETHKSDVFHSPTEKRD